MKIGLTKEGKIPVDHRVPLTPTQAREVMDTFPGVEVVAQSSDIRAFKDEEYVAAGVRLADSLEDCEIILGVKEVPIPMLLEGKTYFFFSHTIKEQAYNRKLLLAILEKNIHLVDYEPLTDETGKRVIAFGRWAGIVGAYNGLWTYGRRYNLFNLRRASECFDLADLKTEYLKIKLPKIKIVLTGGGRVAKGAMEVLLGVGIRKVSPADFVEKMFDEPVFTQLNTHNYNKRKDGQPFGRTDFYKNPEQYEGDFLKYAHQADILIACAFWAPEAPVLFTREDILDDHFTIKVIADITCDIEGSIPSTKRPSTIDKPLYDYNPTDDREEPAMVDETNITVMAIDNLPCELPRDASESFGREMIDNVLPSLLGEDSIGMIRRASITRDGKLTEEFGYLQDYVEGK
jgi:saccharopine dehydrogenase (NAD+, L-lysine-forming)